MPKSQKWEGCEQVFLFTGGNVSGIGKGSCAAVLGRLLLEHTHWVPTYIKIDPYLNLNAGSLAPKEHGEVFVTQDGGETDLDLGSIERAWTSRAQSFQPHLSERHSLTLGKVFAQFLNQYQSHLGETLQLNPHMHNVIVDWLEQTWYLAKKKEPRLNVLFIELGGTLFDSESIQFFVPALVSWFAQDSVPYVHIHLDWLPSLCCDEQKASTELKTRPIQHSVQQVLHLFHRLPDILICRHTHAQDWNTDLQLKLQTRLKRLNPTQQSICVASVPNLQGPFEMYPYFYEHVLVPWQKQVPSQDDKSAALDPNRVFISDSSHWHSRWQSTRDSPPVRVGLVGKYVGATDAYLSVIKSIEIAGLWSLSNVQVEMIDAEELTTMDVTRKRLGHLRGIIVPGGYGTRGIDGMLLAIEYARTSKIPFLGLCLGMQLAVIEFARHVAMFPKATSAEFLEDDGSTSSSNCWLTRRERTKDNALTKNPQFTTHIQLSTPSLLRECYPEAKEIHWRRRHHYEWVMHGEDATNHLKQLGLHITGICSPDRHGLSYHSVDVIELSLDLHLFFMGIQTHPEFSSSIESPSPVFSKWIRACVLHV